MDSHLRRWLEDRGMTEEEAMRRCSKIGLAEVLRVLLEGSQTMPSLALRIGRALGMDAEDVKPLGHPLDKRIWLRKNSFVNRNSKAPPMPDDREASGLPTPNAIDIDDNWYERLGSRTLEHNQLDMGALIQAVAASGQDWPGFRDAHISDIRGAQNARRKEATVRRHAEALAADLGCRAEDLLTDRNDTPHARAPGQPNRPKTIVGEVSVNMLEAVRHEKCLSREEAGNRWCELGEDDIKYGGAQAWISLLYRLGNQPTVREMTCRRIEKTLGVKRDRFLK